MIFIEGNTKLFVKVQGSQMQSIEGTFAEAADQLWAICENLPKESYIVYGGIELAMDPDSKQKTLVIPKIPEGIQKEMEALSDDDPEIFAQIHLARCLNMMPN